MPPAAASRRRNRRQPANTHSANCHACANLPSRCPCPRSRIVAGILHARPRAAPAPLAPRPPAAALSSHPLADVAEFEADESDAANESAKDSAPRANSGSADVVARVSVARRPASSNVNNKRRKNHNKGGKRNNDNKKQRSQKKEQQWQKKVKQQQEPQGQKDQKEQRQGQKDDKNNGKQQGKDQLQKGKQRRKKKGQQQQQKKKGQRGQEEKGPQQEEQRQVGAAVAAAAAAAAAGREQLAPAAQVYQFSDAQRWRWEEYLAAAAPALFEAGALLGQGGFGEVRRVDVAGGASFAMKREKAVKTTGLALNDDEEEEAEEEDADGCGRKYATRLDAGVARGFVCMPLAGATVGEFTYTLLPLERGELGDAWLEEMEPHNAAWQWALGWRKLARWAGNFVVGRALNHVQRRLLPLPWWLNLVVSAGFTPRVPSAVVNRLLASSRVGCCLAGSREVLGPKFKAAAAETAAGVACFHDAGLVHGDLKPPNFLVTRDGRVCVSDLGSVHDVADGDSLVCTALFAPPEVGALHSLLTPWGQLKARFWPAATFWELPDGGCAGDVWALGMTWLALLLPFDDFQATSQAMQRKRGWLGAAPPAAAAMLPEDLRDLIFGGMLRRDARERLTIAQVQAHPYFGDVDWAAVRARRAAAPF